MKQIQIKTPTVSNGIRTYGMGHTFFTFASTGDHLLTPVLLVLKGQRLWEGSMRKCNEKLKWQNVVKNPTCLLD